MRDSASSDDRSIPVRHDEYDERGVREEYTERDEVRPRRRDTVVVERDHVRDHARDDLRDDDHDDDNTRWQERGRVVLTPIAAPSIMGLTGFMLATLMVGAWQAGWYGNVSTGEVLWPFALVAGGLLQSAAAMWSFRARDSVAVAVHTAWGSFWIAWGILQLLATTGTIAPISFGSSNAGFAFWFIGLTVITGTCMLGSLADNLAITLVLAALTGGAGLTAAGFFAGSSIVNIIGGWFFVVSAGLAWYAVSAMVLEGAFGRTILPTGAMSKDRNIPGRQALRPIEYRGGMPGVRVGQ